MRHAESELTKVINFKKLGHLPLDCIWNYCRGRSRSRDLQGGPRERGGCVVVGGP